MPVEIILVIIIIALQVYFFWITYRNIAVYKELFPRAENCQLLSFLLLPEDLENHAPATVLDEIETYNRRGQAYPEGALRISLLADTSVNALFKSIKRSINTYLLRNSTATADFALLKDIAERNNDAADDKISSTISVPLYLGLLGTLLGVVIGLFNISDISGGLSADTSEMLDTAIPTLLNGVKIAMIASFTGLLLTVVNAAFFRKSANSINAQNRNDFYTFLQVELLPVVNSSMEGTFRNLQSNLAKFNEDFSGGLVQLRGVMTDNSTAIAQQAELIEMLWDIDITTFAKANVTILKQLEKTLGKLETLDQYLNQVNHIFNGTQLLTAKINEFLERTENLESLAEMAYDTTETTQQLTRFLQSHYSELDKSRQLTVDAVIKVEKSMSGALGELENFTRQKIDSIRSIEAAEEKRIQGDYAERWEQLSHLRQLEELVKLQQALNKEQKAQSKQLQKLGAGMETLAGNRGANGITFPENGAPQEHNGHTHPFLPVTQPSWLYRFLFIKKEAKADA